MDYHILTFCPVLNPDAKKPSAGGTPVCHQMRCHTKMVVPIRCSDGCGFDFCAAHRAPKDHACSGKQSGPSTGAEKSTTFRSKLQNGTAAGEKAGLAALRRAQVAMSSSGVGKGKGKLSTAAKPIIIDESDDEVRIVSPKKASAKIGIAGLGLAVGKVDRRVLAERASARKALEARAKKG